MSLAVATLIDVEDLRVEYRIRRQWHEAVSGVSFSIARGEIFGLAGESGCGKSTIAFALMGVARPGSRITSGRVAFENHDLLTLPERELRAVRGARISFVPQNPITSLTPSMTCGRQVAEVMHFHGRARGSAAIRETLALLKQVGLPDPPVLFHKYPHQLSGGQQQRMVIAMALACRPRLIVLDEPTTGLDVVTQWHILKLLAELRDRLGTALLYVSHDLGALSEICDRIAVMYAGQFVEVAPRAELFERPRHPYTRGLLESIPRIDRPPGERPALRSLPKRAGLAPGCRFAPRCDFAEQVCRTEDQRLTPAGAPHRAACRRWPVYLSSAAAPSADPARRPLSHDRSPQPGHDAPTLIDVCDLEIAYRRRFWPWRPTADDAVVRGLSFRISEGETFALVGESGSGKSTVARAMLGLVPVRAGSVVFEGRDVTLPIARRPRRLKQLLQIVFQNPDASLNPRHSVGSILRRPLAMFHRLRGEAARQRAVTLLSATQLGADNLARLPKQLSGGERQRVAIARALAAEPHLLICDEILSALDVSVQASIITLMRELQRERGLAYLFISHDLSVVRWLAHKVGVLYRGQLCEIGRVEQVFAPPYHPYTELLLTAAPRAIRGRQAIPQAAPRTLPALPGGCPFVQHCPRRIGGICENVVPPLQAIAPDHTIRCHIPATELRVRQANLAGMT